MCSGCVWEVRLRPPDCHVCTCYFGLHGNCLSHANHQGCFAGTGAIVRLPQCQWSKPDGYGKISQCLTTTKHSKAKTVCIFLGIYCTWKLSVSWKSPVQMQENEIMIKTDKEHTASNKFSLQYVVSANIVVYLACWNLEAWRKCLTFSRQHFPVHVVKWKFLYFYSVLQECVFYGLIGKNLVFLE